MNLPSSLSPTLALCFFSFFLSSSSPSECLHCAVYPATRPRRMQALPWREIPRVSYKVFPLSYHGWCVIYSFIEWWCSIMKEASYNDKHNSRVEHIESTATKYCTRNKEREAACGWHICPLTYVLRHILSIRNYNKRHPWSCRIFKVSKSFLSWWVILSEPCRHLKNEE